jgi:hypothetical protein
MCVHVQKHTTHTHTAVHEYYMWYVRSCAHSHTHTCIDTPTHKSGGRYYMPYIRSYAHTYTHTSGGGNYGAPAHQGRMVALSAPRVAASGVPVIRSNREQQTGTYYPGYGHRGHGPCRESFCAVREGRRRFERSVCLSVCLSVWFYVCPVYVCVSCGFEHTYLHAYIHVRNIPP